MLTAAALAACADPPEPPQAAAGPPTFVGSDACRDCHADQFERWQGSHHQLAMQVAAPDTVLGDFDETSFEYHGESTRFFRRDGDFVVGTAGPDGEPREYTIAYTFGVEPLQQYLVEFPGGRLQALPFCWDTRPASEGGQEWFHVYGDEYIGTDDPLFWTGREQNWNYQCAECHSTGVVMGYDAGRDAFETTYSEISVGCEACHGPGSLHIESASTDDGSSGLVVDLDDQGDAAWIMDAATGIARRSPAKPAPQRQPEVCGRCHARRGTITEDYEYGHPLAHTHRPALLREPLYFADGQIRDEVYVYGSFRQSRMYRAGVTCSDCHDPHTAELRTGGEPDAVCAGCHLPARFADVAHAGHESSQAGCADCHMPERTYMVVDDRRDHSFRVPRPDLSAELDVPNACNGCHVDRDAAWAAASIQGWRQAGATARSDFATAFAAGHRGYANARLRGIAADEDEAAIVRATAVDLLATPLGLEDLDVLEAAFDDPDALVRMAAMRRLRFLPPEVRVDSGGVRLLSDPVRSVRLEAALAYAGMTDLLPARDARAWGRAALEYRESLAMIASRPEAHAALGEFEAELGDTGAAMSAYETALQIEPSAAVARANLADLYRGLGDDERAEALLTAGLELDADDPALLHALGLLYVRTGRRDQSVELLGRAADLARDNARYTYVHAVALHSTGNTGEALGVLRDAYREFPGDFDIGWALATMLEESGDIAAALRVAEELGARYPESSGVRALIDRLRARQ